jgi:hypothetical protein
MNLDTLFVNLFFSTPEFSTLAIIMFFPSISLSKARVAQAFSILHSISFIFILVIVPSASFKRYSKNVSMKFFKYCFSVFFFSMCDFRTSHAELCIRISVSSCGLLDNISISFLKHPSKTEASVSSEMTAPNRMIAA